MKRRYAVLFALGLLVAAALVVLFWKNLGFTSNASESSVQPVLSTPHVSRIYSTPIRRSPPRRILVAWGSKYNHELAGLGLSDIKQVSASMHTDLALMDNGKVLGWGNNKDRQITNEERDFVKEPAEIVGLKETVQVSAGRRTCGALDSKGSVWIWGDNRFGQRGLGNRESRLGITQVPGLPPIKQIAVADDSVYALSQEGKLFVWGDNQNGQLGIGNSEEALSPVQVQGIGNISYLSVNYSLCLAVENSGRILTWGCLVREAGAQGGLGLGDDNPRLSPTELKLPPGVKHVYSGGLAGYALMLDGSVYGWGWNLNHRLALPHAGELLLVPQLIIAAEYEIVEMSAGCEGHCLAVKKDGTVVAWGSNDYGQLGDGTSETQAKPVKVLGIANAVTVVAAANHSLAVVEE